MVAEEVALLWQDHGCQADGQDCAWQDHELGPGMMVVLAWHGIALLHQGHGCQPEGQDHAWQKQKPGPGPGVLVAVPLDDVALVHLFPPRYLSTC